MSNFKINGTKYVRIYDSNNEEWSPLSLIYTPQKTVEVNPTNAINTTDNKGNIFYTETTAGFTFNWTQINNTYTIQKDFYEYETIGEFDSIPIGNNPYIFGNLIGKIDIKIDKNSIAVRSTLPSGSIIKNVNTTFFVPRIE